MSTVDKNPLGIKKKLYTVEEFGAVVRSKFGGDNYISNIMLGEMFLAKFPVYSVSYTHLTLPTNREV